MIALRFLVMGICASLSALLMVEGKWSPAGATVCFSVVVAMIWSD